MENEAVLCIGLVERIGIDGSILTQKKDGVEGKYIVEQPMKDHQDAIKLVLAGVQDSVYGGVKDMSEIDAVGHRVVHGGEKFASSVVITEEVEEAIRACNDLAPLHNPANLMGIDAMKAILPGVPNVAVFDTAFHQTMEPAAYLYGVPHRLYDEYGVRRYGFHGTSHKYVADRAAKMMNVSLDDMKLITCHLGNGASVSAIKRGKCIDTSMGFTPLEGLVMGTRCGDIDPSITTYISEKEHLSAEEMNEIMNKKSGVLGISGISSDFRDIEAAAEEGNERAQLALKVFAHKVRAYIGAFIAEMNGLDALVFTAGVGENDIAMRDIICNDLGNLGIKLDLVKNKIRGKECIISRSDSPVTIMLIPTNEELMIARDTVDIVENR